MRDDEDEADVPGSSGLSATMTQSQQLIQNSDKMEPIEISAIIEEIDNELQRDQQGISDPNVLRNLLLKLEMSKIGEKSGQECKVDSLAFKKFSQLMVSKASLLKDGQDRCLNMKDFARNLRDFAREEHEAEYSDAATQHDFNAFIMIGEKLSHLLFKAPPLHFMRPCIPFNENLRIKEKKERARSQRTISQAKVQVIAGKTTEQAKLANASEEDSSVTRELDIVRRHIRNACKQSSNGAIDYFRFVLHPKSFGESVENMFYVSFLVRDGHIRLNVDERTGGATIERLSREEHKRIDAVDRSALDTTQLISRVDYALWKKLVDRLKITEPMIVR